MTNSPLYYVCSSSYTNSRRKSLNTCTVTPQANQQTLKENAQIRKWMTRLQYPVPEKILVTGMTFVIAEFECNFRARSLRRLTLTGDGAVFSFYLNLQSPLAIVNYRIISICHTGRTDASHLRIQIHSLVDRSEPHNLRNEVWISS